MGYMKALAEFLNDAEYREDFLPRRAQDALDFLKLRAQVDELSTSEIERILKRQITDSSRASSWPSRKCSSGGTGRLRMLPKRPQN
jgi:hypothetical protein